MSNFVAKVKEAEAKRAKILAQAEDDGEAHLVEEKQKAIDEVESQYNTALPTAQKRADKGKEEAKRIYQEDLAKFDAPVHSLESACSGKQEAVIKKCTETVISKISS